MLPAGPRSTYPVPPAPQLGARELARQILGSIQSRIAAATELKVGTAIAGCDGMANINPLNGTNCNGVAPSACDLVLYNPQNRVVVSDSVGRALSGSLGSCGGVLSSVTSAPASCDKVVAALRKRRRFLDGSGNVYGPDGARLGGGIAVAHLETDYIHRLETGSYKSYNGILADPPQFLQHIRASLEKTTGVTRSSIFLVERNNLWPPPTLNDVGSSVVVNDPFDFNLPITPVLEDCTIGRTGTTWPIASVVISINSLGTMGSPDTFNWSVTSWSVTPYGTTGSTLLGSGSNVPIHLTQQSLAADFWVQFQNKTGHSLTRTYSGGTRTCSWIGIVTPNNEIVRNGVAVRGTLDIASPCINGGFPNSNVLLTAEADVDYGQHALVVRNPDSLAQLYAKALDHNGTSYAFGDPPPLFSFSTNDEGLFFMHCYVAPSLVSPPTPFPGHEYGAPNPRKIAVISVNGLTFEPTIVEVITLDPGAGFVTAYTAPG